MSTMQAIYLRISKDKTGLKAGVERQLGECRDHFGEGTVYTDNDLSASSRRKKRPGFERLLRDIESGEVTSVVAWHTDRLYRRFEDLSRLVQAVEGHNVQIRTLHAGEFDLTSASGRMVARMLGAAASHEVERSSERLKSKARQLATEGKYSGSRRPFGFEKNGVTHRASEVEVIRNVVKRLLGGETASSLINELNQRGIKPANGQRWANWTFRYMLTAPRICGLRQHRGEVIGTAAWEPIISQTDWRRLKVLYARHASRQTPRRYALSGMYVCGRCGAKLVSRPKNQKRYWFCAADSGHGGCGKLGLLATPADEYVVSEALDKIFIPEAQGEQDDSEVAILQERQEALGLAFSKGQLSLRAFTSADTELKRLMEELTAKRVPNLPVILDPDTGEPLEFGSFLTQAEFEALPLQAQHALLKRHIEKVVVHPAKPGAGRFDPGRIEILWKAWA